ncbi:helix-turn-helix domain-containing protein [soil metagenome]
MGEYENFGAGDDTVRIGALLEKTRQDLGLTHEDVERVTKIRVRYLEAMERDDYDSLPGLVYSQGFLKTYANYLDLDGEALSQELKSRHDVHEQGHLQRASSERPRKRGAGEGRSSLGAGRRQRPRPRMFSVLTVVGAALAFVVLAIVVAGLYFVGLRASDSANSSSEKPASAEGTPVATTNSSRTPNAPPTAEELTRSTTTDEPVHQTPGTTKAILPEPAPPEPPPPEGIEMEVRVEGNISWLNIEADGNVVFEQVAESGFSQTFKARESITVWSGNAGAVFISVNGQDYGMLGESGQTKIQEFNLKTAEN